MIKFNEIIVLSVGLMVAQAFISSYLAAYYGNLFGLIIYLKVYFFK